MKRTILALIAVLATLITMCVYAATPPQQEQTQTEDVRTYESNVDYIDSMIIAVANDDMDSLSDLIDARNAKIEDMNLPYERISVDFFMNNFEQFAGFSLYDDYAAIMKECCLNGDFERGEDAAMRRNKKIEVLGIDQDEFSFTDLLELSRVITAEDGSSWIPIERKMKVGEVVLNRVASIEFPDTIYDVIHQYGQYSNANTWYFKHLTPYDDCVDAALRLLNGERSMVPSVVFQAEGKQGSGVHEMMHDPYSGYIFFCYSNRPELYE